MQLRQDGSGNPGKELLLMVSDYGSRSLTRWKAGFTEYVPSANFDGIELATARSFENAARAAPRAGIQS